GSELRVDRAGHVDAYGGRVGPEQVDPPNAMCGEALLREPREGHGVARGRVDGIDRGIPGGAVVRVVHAAVAVEQRLRIGGEHGVRPESSNLAHAVLAPTTGVGQGPRGPGD